MEPQTVKEIKPIDYVKIIFRRKWFLIIPLFIGSLAGLIAGNTMPKIYESSTLILVEEGRIINPLIQGIAVSTSTAQRLIVLREQILGWDRILQLIKSLDLARDVRSQLQFEGLVKSLRRSIRVDLRGPNIIMISYEGKDPGQAQAIVKTITDIFISENLRQQTKETEDAVTFINDQLSLYQKKLKQSEIAAMEEELKKLLVDSTPKHPMVIELETKIKSATDELERGDYNVDAHNAAGSNDELKALKEDLKKMKDEASGGGALEGGGEEGGPNRTRVSSASNEKLYKLLLMDKLSQVEARDAGVTQKLYNTLLERMETAKITQRLESSKEGTRYTILDPARLPLKAKKPNKVMTLFMGVFIGGCIGIAMIFLIELFDHSFLGIDDAKSFFELPIFGAVPKIVTEDDLKEQRMRNTRIAGISIATGLVLVVVIILNVFMGN